MKKVDRYKLIMERQGQVAWGQGYKPAILANRVEGPKCSRLTQIVCPQLGRVIHLLSGAERSLAFLALYNPNLFDLHEQRVLSPLTAPHPLDGHPRAAGMVLPKVLGTVEFAIECGGRHEHVQVSIGKDHIYVPYPYLGDLLLYLQSPTGLPYCVNWTIKAEVGDFSEKRRSALKDNKKQIADRTKALYRQHLEDQHYAAAGIRTIQLTPHDIEGNVLRNLEFLYSWLSVKQKVSSEVISEFDDELTNAILSGNLINSLVISYASKWGDRQGFLARVFQNIWNRKISINLFPPLLIDKPFSIEGKDVLDVYSSLFMEKCA